MYDIYYTYMQAALIMLAFSMCFLQNGIIYISYNGVIKRKMYIKMIIVVVFTTGRGGVKVLN